MTYLKSKFKIFPILLIAYLSILPLFVIYMCFISLNSNMIYAILFFLFIVFFWFTVLRTRASSIKMYEDGFAIKRYFGLGKSSVYKYVQADGFVTIFETAKGGLYESIFILENGKRIGSISSFYHNNFDMLKLTLENNLTNLGKIKNSVIRESVELFK